MEIFQREGSKSTPAITLNFLNGTFELKGISIPENAIGFYEPVLEAIREYENKAQANTTVTFALTYFNTSSSKCILRILSAFADMHKRVTKVKVEWYYDISDDDQLETANDLEDSCNLEFKYIGVDPDEYNP